MVVVVVDVTVPTVPATVGPSSNDVTGPELADAAALPAVAPTALTNLAEILRGVNLLPSSSSSVWNSYSTRSLNSLTSLSLI